MDTELQLLKNELLETQKEMVINLSTTTENFTSPQAARESVSAELRNKGLIISYSCDGRLLMDRYTGNNATDYLNPYYWEAVFGTQDNGKITDLNYVPKSWELRKGSYFTSELEGTFTNLFDQHGNKWRSERSGLKKFNVEVYPDGSIYQSHELNEYTGIEFQWAAVNRGAIEYVGTYKEGDEFFAKVVVYPNTMCMGVANKATLFNCGTDAIAHDRKIKEGTFNLKVGDEFMFMLAVDRSGDLIAFSNGLDGQTDSLPPVTLSKDCLLIGFFGHANRPIAPYSEEHVFNNDFTRNIHSSNLSERTFVDISKYIKELDYWADKKFFGEASLTDVLECRRDIYYLTVFDEPGEYRYESISFDVSIKKAKTVVAICCIEDSATATLKWAAVEVPVSKMPQDRIKIQEYTLNPGVYVLIDEIRLDGREYPDLIGNSGAVQIVSLSRLVNFPTVNISNIDFYNAILTDFGGKDDYTIEGCKFSGYPAYYHSSLYFLNTGYYDRERLHNVVIRNCIFNLPTLFAGIYGEKLNAIEITGCEFNTKSIHVPIRINNCAKGALIRNNKVNYGTTGIFFAGSKEMPISNCVVENNILLNQLEEAISFDGFGNSIELCPVIGEGKILDVFNDANGRLVIKPELRYFPLDFVSEFIDENGKKIATPLSIYKMSDKLYGAENGNPINWTKYYATFNEGTGIDGTFCRIYSFDIVENTLTLDIFMDASKVNDREGTNFGVQSGFFDCVVRNNIIASDIFERVNPNPTSENPNLIIPAQNTGLSIYLNVFNMLVENNKVYRMNSFMNVAGGAMLGHHSTLAWGNRVINNTFMNCNTGSFYSHNDKAFPVFQYNNVFRGNILKNIGSMNKNVTNLDKCKIGLDIEYQRNFDYRDNIFDNVDNVRIFKCEGYMPKESELGIQHLGQVYNKFKNDPDGYLTDIEQKIVRKDSLSGNLVLKDLA